jgi:hypothetical protein
MDLPYAQSTAGQAREKEIRDQLRGVGASAVGFMVDEDADMVICQFRLHGRQITIPVSIGAYETAWLRANPCGPRTDPKAHKAKARKQAERAVWAVLADWIKAQTAMMLCGFLDTDTAFLPHIHAADGRRVIEVARGASNLLPKPEGEKP